MGSQHGGNNVPFAEGMENLTTENATLPPTAQCISLSVRYLFHSSISAHTQTGRAHQHAHAAPSAAV